jgi:hypothetical protein
MRVEAGNERRRVRSGKWSMEMVAMSMAEVTMGGWLAGEREWESGRRAGRQGHYCTCRVRKSRRASESERLTCREIWLWLAGLRLLWRWRVAKQGSCRSDYLDWAKPILEAG